MLSSVQDGFSGKKFPEVSGGCRPGVDPAAVFLGWSGAMGTSERVERMALWGVLTRTFTLQMGKLRHRGA